MKTILAIVTAASLIVNAALVYLLATANHSSSVESAQSVVAAAGSRAPKVDASLWPSLHSDDVHTTIAQLRAAGFPEHIIRAIIAAQLQEPYGARLKALLGERSSRPYWKNAVFTDPKVMAELRDLSREQKKALDDLLGPDPEGRTGGLFDQTDLGFLPAEKGAQVHRVLDDFQQRRMDLFSAGFDQAKMAALEKEQHDALAAVLTPDELLQYDLRNSNTARSLRERMAAFDPTEAEFVAVYKLQAAFDQQYAPRAGMTQTDFRQRFEAQKQLTEQIKAALSPDRAAVYDRATDYNYVMTTRLMARLELTPETANTLYDVQKEFEQRRNEVARTQGMSFEQRTEALNALQQEAITKLTPILGSSSALEAYKQYGGTWIRSLAPPTRRGSVPMAPDAVIPLGGG